MNDKFLKLSELGAGDFEHIDGSLIEHLRGTKALLEDWSAPPILQDAGLYHAAYGTAGFEQYLVSTEKRDMIAEIIGAQAEEIVYRYCACDREYFFPQFGVRENPEFRNRFTGESHYLTSEAMRTFCELTAANEVEIASDNPAFMQKHGASLQSLFTGMSPYLSRAAQSKTEFVFGARDA